MRTAAAILPLLFITACASTPPEVPGPDGTPHRLVSCQMIESCYTAAAKVCGGKYQIVHTANQNMGMTWRNQWSTTNLLIKCGEALPVPPAPKP